MAGRSVRTAVAEITMLAASAAQSSAGSQPLPPMSAMLMPTNAASDVIASDRWCHASAVSATLADFSPAAATRRNNNSLMTTTPTSTTRVNGAGAWCGIRISRTASMEIPAAAASKKIATIAADNASALPYPNWNSSSGSRAAMRSPLHTITDDRTSPDDSTASAMSA